MESQKWIHSEGEARSLMEPLQTRQTELRKALAVVDKLLSDKGEAEEMKALIRGEMMGNRLGPGGLRHLNHVLYLEGW